MTCSGHDVSSLEVLDYLITDRQKGNAVMIVGHCRSNEVGAGRILNDTIRTLSTKMDKYHFEMTNIDGGKFPVPEMNHVIMKILSNDDENFTRGLAKLSHRRTLDNSYFLSWSLCRC